MNQEDNAFLLGLGWWQAGDIVYTNTVFATSVERIYFWSDSDL